MHTSGNNMQYSVQSKSQLAKLLASENLIVEHKKVQTASFDLKNRILSCPIWKDMSGEMYDLLLGHEVGHALETPEEGWHDAVTTGKSKFSKNFKHFLNVVEDARIEKKIKRKFPGIKPSFIKAYGQLIDRDFFGIKDQDVNALPFIDRLNLYTKGGYNLGIKFDNADESALLEAVEACESWEDVVEVTGAIFDYSKKEQQEESKLKQKATAGDSYGENDDYDYDESDNYSDYDYDESDDGDDSTNDGDDTENDNDGDSDSESDETTGEEYGERKVNRYKDTRNSFSDNDDDFEPRCETDENFRDNEGLLLDEKSKEYVYVNIPKYNPKNSITTYKRVHELMENFWFKGEYLPDVEHNRSVQENLLKEFKNRNERYVSLLAKEFEMRKAASKFSKQKISETGDIDISRIYKYKVDDNIFRKVMRVPKGKSHGLVLILDRSGSMDDNMPNSIEQILILTMFCRKVNIPFVVYGFGNCMASRALDIQFDGGKMPPSFSKNKNDLYFSDVFMREYMNSRMGNAEFNRCLRNMVSLMNSYMPRFQRKINRPSSETLSNTPMIEAMVASRYITNEFRKVNNLDIVNMVLIHDGDADNISGYYEEGMTDYGTYKTNWFSEKTQSVVIRDEQSKTEFLLKNENNKDNDPMRVAIFDWYKQVTGAKIVGFFLIGAGHHARAAIQRKYISGNELPVKTDQYNSYESHNRWLREKEEAREMLKVIKTTKFLESKNGGYNKFFLIPGGNDLNIEEEELSVEGNVTASKLRTAFIKMNKKKQVSRVLVNRFIGEIAM